MKKDPKVFLEHILESIILIEEYTGDLTEDEFAVSIAMQDATLRRLMVIGEASNNIPKEFQNAHSEIVWRDIIGLRNVVIHEYFGVSLQMIWDIVQKDLPVLKRQVEGMLYDVS